MKAAISTRVLISMSEAEARATCSDALDLQLSLRKALQQIDGIPISQLSIQQKKSDRKLLSAPRPAKDKQRKKHTISAPDKECPYCHEFKSPCGYPRHFASCAAKHSAPSLT